MLCRAALRKTLSGEGLQRLSKLSTRFQGWCCVDDVMADPTPRRLGEALSPRMRMKRSKIMMCDGGVGSRWPCSDRNG